MIDWFTVIAQLINFLVLIALLKYFLYGRVLNAINKRDQELAAVRDEANQALEDARAEVEAATWKNQQLDQQREKLLTDIRSEVDEFRQQQMKTTREEIDKIQQRWVQSIRGEQQAFLRDLRMKSSDSVCAMARRALRDLADTELERQVVLHFLSQLRLLSDQQRRLLVDTLAERQVAVIQTAFDLPDELKTRLQKELQTELCGNLRLRFEQVDDLQCGIAMQTNSHKLGWNLRDYVTAVEEDMRSLVADEEFRYEEGGRLTS